MNQFCLHPFVYSTGPLQGLRTMLEQVWVKDVKSGRGTMYLVSGFGNYNGGVRFYKTFRDHIANGGTVKAYLGGAAGQRLTSKQVVKELLECGVDVHLINRKRILHAKCYGVSSPAGDSLVVSSGNFTGPGMSQNIEASLLMNLASTATMGFSWDGFLKGIAAQNFEIHKPSLKAMAGPAWRLVYDEIREPAQEVEGDLDLTLLLTLGHHDTARINAQPGSNAGAGSQYFWLSKDCFDFFPPLTIPNARGRKTTYSCIVTMNYVDLGISDDACRVTFEAENNLDFRLGTGKLRYTKQARAGDIAAISRVAESVYDLRIFRQGTPIHGQLNLHAINFIGNQQKKYGFVSNVEFARIAKLPAAAKNILPKRIH